MKRQSTHLSHFDHLQLTQFHHRALVVDMHADTLQRVLDEGVDLRAGAPGLHLDLPGMRAGGVDAQFFSIWPNPYQYWGESALERALALITSLKAQIQRHSEVLEQALSASDIRRIANKGKIAALMGIEGGHAINEDLDALREFFKLGVRYLTLTHSRSLSWAGSSGDAEGPQRGLSDFGREVVREMNRLGMMVDISHVSDRTFWDTLAVTTKPVIASHSAARALAPHPRNLTDEMIRAVAATGGVVCVVFFPVFLAQDSSQVNAVTLDRVVDHIDHIVHLTGIDHVGIGSDFDGIDLTPHGMETVARLPALTIELARRSYRPQEIEKVLGGNVLRVMEAQA
jgi:membrane dipeptidase